MTELYINGEKAQIDESTSIKLVDENPYLTKSSKYTYDIELSLKGNSSNRRIFRNINRLDVSKIIKKQKAYMVANNHNVINGTTTITSISDSTVKIQILSGNSELNFLSKYEKLYIDELKMGSMLNEAGTPMFGTAAISSFAYIKDESLRIKKMFGTYNDTNFVFFPVYNEQKGQVYNDVCLRKMTSTSESVFWESDMYGPPSSVGGLISNTRGKASAQPYFVIMINKIFECLGYKVLENQIVNTPLKNIFIVNYKEDSGYTKMLPHWTISEFMEQVENFFGVVFKTDDNEKSIRILLRESWGDKEDIQLKEIIDEYSVNCDEEETTDISNGNVSYAFNEIDKYLKIDDDVLKIAEKKAFETQAELHEFYAKLSTIEKGRYIYEAGGKQYIQYNGSLREVNQFRNLIRNEESDNSNIELKIIPVRMTIRRTKWEGCVYDDFYKKWCPTTGVDFNTVMMSVSGNEQYVDGNQNVQDMIEGNTVNQNTKDTIEVAMNDGVFQQVTTDDGGATQFFPWPFVLTSDPLKEDANRGFSFELNKVDGRTTMYNIVFNSVIKINTQCEIMVRFITNKMYDTMKRFIIRNKSYICKKIEYKIENKGIDPEKTGYFHEVS